MRTEVNINANMLTWAITRAGFDLHEFAGRVLNLLGWVSGDKKPAVKQLEDFSKKVYLPFGYFFLQEPPRNNGVRNYLFEIMITDPINPGNNDLSCCLLANCQM